MMARQWTPHRGTWASVAWSAGITLALLLAAVLSLESPALWIGSIDLYLLSLALASVLIPSLGAGETTDWEAMFPAGAVVDTIACLWLWSVIQGPVSLGAWAGCYAILAMFAFAQWNWMRLLGRWIGPTLSAATVVLVSLAWITWPIWLSIHLSGQMRGIHWLVRLHPGLAMNTLLADAYGIWTEQPFAYRFTNLNQDIPYALPGSWWCIIGLALIGAIPWLSQTCPGKAWSKAGA